MTHAIRYTLTLLICTYTIYPAHTTFWRYPDQCITRNIACLHIEGGINDAGPYIPTLNAIKQNADGLLIIINSGGGSAGDSEVIYRELRDLASQIPVVTFVKNICASGAYLIACASHHIITPQSAVVGSIGTYMSIEKENIKSFQQKSSSQDDKQETVISGDVTYEIISASDKKTTTHPLSGELSDEDRQELQEKAREMADLFADIVAQSRNLHHNRDAWNDGDIFTGATACELGLIDSNGGCSDALRELHTRIQVREPRHIIHGMNITHWNVGDC